MKEIITYSSAIIKTFEQCPKKFEYKYIKEINIPSNTKKAEQGKNIHALANYYLRNFNIDKLENVLTQNEKILWQNLKNNKFFNMETVKSEYSITSKIGNFIVAGRLDALIKNKENYFILDYKTGNIPQNAEKDYQTIIYLLITDKILNKYNSLKFVYLDLKNNTEKIIDFNKKIKVEYKQILESKINEIEKCIKNNIYKKNNESSKCEYEKICTSES